MHALIVSIRNEQIRVFHTSLLHVVRLAVGLLTATSGVRRQSTEQRLSIAQGQDQMR